MKNLLLAISMVFCFYAVSPAQVFKIPKDVFPLESKNTGFHGMVMIRKDDPAGIFIIYPEEKETMDALKERVAKYVVPMFLWPDENGNGIKFFDEFWKTITP